MEFVIPGCVLSRRARLGVIFVVAIVVHAIAAACIFIGKDKPMQVLVGLLIAELAVALVWIVIRMVSRCRERTSLRTARSDGEPNTENDVNTKALAKNDDAEQSQAGTKAAIEEEEEEPNEAARKQIEGDECAGKRSQAEEGGRKAPNGNWLNCIVIAIVVLLVIAGLASSLLGPAHGGAGQRGPFGCVHSGAGQCDPFSLAHSGAAQHGPFGVPRSPLLPLQH
jgi:uncharacterized membrane protein YjgN (DUF898 family)